MTTQSKQRVECKRVILISSSGVLKKNNHLWKTLKILDRVTVSFESA